MRHAHVPISAGDGPCYARLRAWQGSRYGWVRLEPVLRSHVHLAPLQEVFRRFATPAGMESFFVRRARFIAADGTERAPDEFFAPGDVYEFEYVHDFSHGVVVLAPGHNQATACHTFHTGSVPSNPHELTR